VGLEE
jgi:ketosteroid isomerase-like protein